MLGNLNLIERYRAINASVPQCWAYPDMLQVGIRRKKDGAIGLSLAETRSHFGVSDLLYACVCFIHDSDLSKTYHFNISIPHPISHGPSFRRHSFSVTMSTTKK